MKTPNKAQSASVRELRAVAKKCKPGVVSVRHLYPRAYCVAKPATFCAVFAVPPQDAEPQMKGTSVSRWVTVQNSTAGGVSLGDWRSVAYVATSTSSEFVILPA